MIGRARRRAGIDRPLSRLREFRELADRDLVARDEEHRHVDGAFALRRRPALVVEGQRIARTIRTHRERAGRDLDELRGLRLGAWGLPSGLGLAAWGLGKNTRNYI